MSSGSSWDPSRQQIHPSDAWVPIETFPANESAMLLAEVPPEPEPLVYFDVESAPRKGPIVTLVGLALGLLGGIVLGYMLNMAVHGV